MAEPPGVADGLGKKPFMTGVCEGFYGKPWSSEQRHELFERMKTMKMNTYMYAPKDDNKHRVCWRDLYTPSEQDDLKILIKAATTNDVIFVYALSPGLDITYCSETEMTILKQKLQQVADLGCAAFALLFDDIEDELCEADEEVFDSFAHAQSSVTNEIYSYLKEPKVFLFCPTEYCTSRTVPDLPRSEYLQTIGKKLNKNIDILWTGPKVVPKRITTDGLREVQKAIQRRPVIWDNIHANDYDQTRLYLGAYSGRPVELQQCLNGILTNPNCEFEANFIAMHTLAQWSLNTVTTFMTDNDTDKEDSSGDKKRKEDRHTCKGYQPKLALQKAIQDWIPVLYKVKGNHKQPSDSAADTVMDTSETAIKKFKEEKTSPAAANKQKLEDLGPLCEDEVQLLCDLFYLPFDHGPSASHLLKSAHWLVSNASVIEGWQKKPKADMPADAQKWFEKAKKFHEHFLDVAEVADKFMNIPNRVLLYELYHYVGDMRSVLALTNSYIKWLASGKPNKEPFVGGCHEPWVNRGGLHSEFRRLLPMEGKYDMYSLETKPSASTVYTIRPYLEEDKDSLREICIKTFDDGEDGSDLCPMYPDLIPDRYLAPFLEFSPDHCYVLEGEQGLCGFVLGTPNIEEFNKRLHDEWFPKMQNKYPAPDKKENLSPAEEIIQTFYGNTPKVPKQVVEMYPSFAHLRVLPAHRTDPHVPARLLNCLLTLLKAQRSKGVHTVISVDDLSMLGFYIQLRFEDATGKEEELSDEDSIIMAKPLCV